MVPAVAVEHAQLLVPGDGLAGVEVDEGQVVGDVEVGDRLGQQAQQGDHEGQGHEPEGQVVSTGPGSSRPLTAGDGRHRLVAPLRQLPGGGTEPHVRSHDGPIVGDRPAFGAGGRPGSVAGDVSPSAHGLAHERVDRLVDRRRGPR